MSRSNDESCPSLRSWSLHVTFSSPLQTATHTGTSPQHCVCIVQDICPPTSLPQLIPTMCQFIQHTYRTLHVQVPSTNLSSSHCKSSSEVKLPTANTLVHIPRTCCPASLLPLSTSVPFSVLETPCKINSSPEQLVLFDKGQKVAYQITPKLAGLAKTNQTNQNASLVCGMGCSTFFIFKLLEYVQIQAQKNSSKINY